MFYSAHLFSFPRFYNTDLDATEAADLLSSNTGMPVEHAEGSEDRCIGVWATFVYEPGGGLLETAVFLTKSGWPVKTMQGRTLHKNGESDSQWIMRTSHSYIPLHPMWLGFLINAVFYAVVLWLVYRGLLALRGLIRRRRGLCPKCAYPVGESSVCTECGRELAT